MRELVVDEHRIMANSFANTNWDFYNVRFDLAPWRVLGKDKCGSLRSPQPSTRHEKDNKNNTENQTESAAARSRPR